MNNEFILYWHCIFSKHKFPLVLVLSQEPIIKSILIINYNQYDQTIYFLQKQSYQDVIFDCTTIHEMNIEDFVDNFELDKSKKYHLLSEEKQEELITLLYKNVILNDNFCVKNISIEELTNKELITYSEYRYVSDSYLKRILGHLNQPHLLKPPRDELSNQLGFNLVNTKGSYGNMVAMVNELFENCTRQTQKTNFTKSK